MNKKEMAKKPEKNPTLPTPEEINKLMPKKWKELTDFEKEMKKLIKEVNGCKHVLRMPGLNPVVRNIIEFMYKFNVLKPMQGHVQFFVDKMMPEIVKSRDDTIDDIKKDMFNKTYREEMERRIKIEQKQLAKLPHDPLNPKKEEKSK